MHETDPVFGAAAEGLPVELGVPLRNLAIRYERRFYDAGRQFELATLRHRM